MRYLFTVAVLWAVATSPAWATQYLCRSTKVLGLIYQTNVPCPGAILIDQTGPYGGWLKTPKEQREARASANQVEAAVKPGMTADKVRQVRGAPIAEERERLMRLKAEKEAELAEVKAKEAHYRAQADAAYQRAEQHRADTAAKIEALKRRDQDKP